MSLVVPAITSIFKFLDTCEELARQAASGDDESRQKLIEYLWPHWLDLVRGSFSMGSLANSQDHVYEVATRLVAKSSEKRGRALQLYVSWHETHFGGRARPQADLERVHVGSDCGRAGRSTPDAQEQIARELIEFAKTRLPTDQIRALAAWLEGGSFEDIDTQLRLSPGQGHRLLRATVAVLRRHFNRGVEEIDSDSA